MTRAALRDLLLTAHRQAQLASALYKGPVEVARLATATNCQYRTFDIDNVSAAALIYRDHVHFVVCGTNDMHDWVQNLMTKTEYADGMFVHRGFLGAATKLARAVKDSGFDQLIRGKRLYLGGHSAGGSIAEVMSVATTVFSPDEIFTFGSPKCMTPESAAAYDANGWRTRRFIMNGDPIPYLPLYTLGYMLGRRQYTHATKAIELRENGDVLSHDGLTFFGKAWSIIKKVYMSGVVWVVPWLGEFNGVIESHSIDRYLHAISLAPGRIQ